MNKLTHFAVAGGFALLSPVEASQSPVVEAHINTEKPPTSPDVQTNHYFMRSQDNVIERTETVEDLPAPPRQPRGKGYLATMGALYPPQRLQQAIRLGQGR